MISARRAALLGLTVPLTAIMIAVLGLWPEPEEPPAAPTPSAVYGGGAARKFDHALYERLRAQDAKERQERRNRLLVLLTAMALEEIAA